MAVEREVCRAAYRGVPRVRMGDGATYAGFEEGWRAHRVFAKPRLAAVEAERDAARRAIGNGLRDIDSYRKAAVNAHADGAVGDARSKIIRAFGGELDAEFTGSELRHAAGVYGTTWTIAVNELLTEGILACDDQWRLHLGPRGRAMTRVGLKAAGCDDADPNRPAFREQPQ